MKKRIIICVPTYNRPEMAAEVLDYEMDHYREAGVDVCYYDSSDNDRTKEIVTERIGKGYSNLSYKRLDSSLCIDFKIIEMWEKDSSLLGYDYIWLINDSISIKKEALLEVIRIAEKGYDLIRLPLTGGGSKEDHICTDCNEWFHNCSQSMAHMASTVMSSRLLKGNIDWRYLAGKYVRNNDIHSKNHGFFFTVGFYLERISELDNFKGIFLGNRVKWRRESPLKQDKSYWNELVFRVWVKSYCDTLFALPDIYTDKESVIRISDNLITGRFSRNAIIAFRIQKLYSLKEFIIYLRYWKLVSDMKLSELFKAAVTPSNVLAKKYGADFGKMSDWEKNIEEIENTLVSASVIIYGAGLYGERVIEKLQKDGFGEKIVSVAVSDAGKNVSSLLGVPVRDIKELSEYKNNALIIIAALPDTAAQILKYLEELGFNNYVSLFRLDSQRQ